MTLRLRYHTWKLRALCWVLRRMLGWGRGGGGLPVPQNEAGPAKGDECDEQRKEVEFYGRVHFKTTWLAKVIINHAGLAPDRKRRVWICLKSHGLARRGRQHRN